MAAKADLGLSRAVSFDPQRRLSFGRAALGANSVYAVARTRAESGVPGSPELRNRNSTGARSCRSVSLLIEMGPPPRRAQCADNI
jgi:hypothetical protein